MRLTSQVRFMGHPQRLKPSASAGEGGWHRKVSGRTAESPVLNPFATFDLHCTMRFVE